jgi:hypothetical protein
MRRIALASLILSGSIVAVGLLGAVNPQRPAADPVIAQHDVSLAQLAHEAIASSPDESAAAIAALRQAGPAGLEALLAACAPQINRHAFAAALNPSAAELPEWARIRAAIEAVSAQRDCHISHLYWYTDMPSALAAAKASGKPILSLRMLGKLNEEYSCANSRFFRTTLYSDGRISDYLKRNFVLYWQSVRPVPRITIDMGDGRKIERTITGNSIHYVLDSRGRLIDGFPGLYSAAAFLEGITRAHDMALAVNDKDDAAFAQALAAYHEDQLQQLDRAAAKDLAAIVPSTPLPTVQPVLSAQRVFDFAPSITPAPRPIPIAVSDPLTVLARTPQADEKQPGSAYETVIASKLPGLKPAPHEFSEFTTLPTARAAMGAATLKSGVEGPMVRALELSTVAPPVSITAATTLPASLGDSTPSEVWQKIAARHERTITFDDGTRQLIGEKNPDAVRAGMVALSKSMIEQPMSRELVNLRRSIAEDTVRNEYLLHRRLHAWLASAPLPANLDAFNERVYADLFLTPSTDPWLGLAPPDTFTALEHEGLISAERR